MNKYLLLLLLCISSSVTYANEEDWYAYWAIGMVNHDYPGGLNSFLNDTESLPGVDRTEIGLDVFGFYKPQSKNNLSGFVFSGSADQFESRHSELQINQYLLGISGMEFFGRGIGDGFFIRGDAGLAWITVSDNSSTTETSDIGFGYLLGVGYAIPVSDESRILISVNFSDKRVEDNSWKSATVMLGGLW